MTDESGRLPTAPGYSGYAPSPDGVGHSASIPSAEAFREAVIDELVCCHIYSAKHDADPRLAIHEAISWNVEVALDPQVSAAARALTDSGYARAMRDSSRLTQEMCGVIGAAPGSSIHAALSACWEKMDDIAQGIVTEGGDAVAAPVSASELEPGPQGCAQGPSA